LQKLIIKAVSEADIRIKAALETQANISDSIHDIKLYLDDSKGSMPSGSEVTVDELFVLVDQCITAREKTEETLREARSWILAILDK
jgi:hypothetical protein